MGRNCNAKESSRGCRAGGAASRTSEPYVQFRLCYRYVLNLALSVLLIRVLYRLRFLSEQAPFDAATFSYAYPLLGRVLVQGGVGSNEEEEAIEQVALALGIIKFHCGECMSLIYCLLHAFSTFHIPVSDPSYPRIPVMENLLHIIRNQPKLSKEASSTLVDLGEAIQSNASLNEFAVLLRGTLFQEVYARNSCLQALQVRRFSLIAN